MFSPVSMAQYCCLGAQEYSKPLHGTPVKELCSEEGCIRFTPGTVMKKPGSHSDVIPMACLGVREAREASGKSAASFPPALALLESGKGSGSGKGCPVALIMLRRFGLGGSTIPRGRPHEGDPRGVGSAFRQRSSLSLWDANFSHASLAPSSVLDPTIPAAWRIA